MDDVIDDVMGRPAEQLEGTLGEDATIYDVFYHGLCQVAADCSGFDNRGHAGQPVDRGLFQHSPYGKVKRIDVYGHAFPRH